MTGLAFWEYVQKVPRAPLPPVGGLWGKRARIRVPARAPWATARSWRVCRSPPRAGAENCRRRGGGGGGDGRKEVVTKRGRQASKLEVRSCTRTIPPGPLVGFLVFFTFNNILVLGTSQCIEMAETEVVGGDVSCFGERASGPKLSEREYACTSLWGVFSQLPQIFEETLGTRGNQLFVNYFQ